AGAIGDAGRAFQIILPILKTFGQYLSAVSQGGDALNDYLLDLPRAIEPLAVYFGTITRIVQAVGRVFTGDFLGALEQVQTAVADAKFYIAWKLQEWGEAFLGWIGPMIPGLLAQLGGLAKSILDWFIESRLQQAEQLTGWATTFLDWIGPMIPPFLVELGKLGASMLTWLEEKVPEVVDRIVVWATTLTDWIAPRIPVLLEEAGKLGASMLDWLQEKVPEIVQKLTIWAAAITDWIAPRIPVLLEEGGKLLTGLLTWVTEKGVPLAKQFVTEWVPAMINWVLQAETDLVPKVGAFITGLLAWVTEKGPPLAYTFLSEWVPAAIGWVAEAAIKILPNLAMLLGTIALWVVSDGIPAIWTLFVSLGGAIVKGVLDGIGNLKDQLANAIGDAVGGAIEEGKRRMSEWRPSLPEIKMPVLGRGGGGMGGLPVPAISPGGWNSPVPGAAISQEYGRTPYSGIYPGGIHTGIDLAAALGRNVFAASSGTVARAGWDSSGYGNMVVIAHGNGLSTLYGHLNKIDVSAGQQVASGQDIGDLGSTGNSSGPHVHFELLRNGSHFNPRSLIPAFAAGVRAFAGGLALVGEKGPEVTYLPPGSDVYSNQDSRRMLGGGQPITVNVHVAGSVQSEQDLVRGIYNGLRELERSGLRLGTN
ncbi:MAG TPA: M23 family metallopeptidase, partial [Chloroflexota bacterium]|nr:M23 family metallopeptidase [Chloroflexota bacterium]